MIGESSPCFAISCSIRATQPTNSAQMAIFEGLCSSRTPLKHSSARSSICWAALSNSDGASFLKAAIEHGLRDSFEATIREDEAQLMSRAELKALAAPLAVADILSMSGERTGL